MRKDEKNSAPVALVTGGSSFLGGAISRKLTGEGFRVVLHHRNSSLRTNKLAADLSAIGPGCGVIRADLGVEGQERKLILETIRKFKRLDLLVNNASRFEPTPFGTSRSGPVEDLIRVNLVAPFLLCQAAAPWIRRNRGSIVNLTDIYGEHPILDGYSVYCASKAALISMTRSLALEMGPEIRVNAVSPGAVFIPKSYSAKKRDDLIARSALRRQGDPVDVAQAVYFLASQPFITGQVLNVDGGRFL